MTGPRHLSQCRVGRARVVPHRVLASRAVGSVKGRCQKAKETLRPDEESMQAHWGRRLNGVLEKQPSFC